MITATWDLRWYGGRVQQQLVRALQRGIRRATLLIEARAKLLAHKAAGRLVRRRTRTTSRGPKGSRYTVWIGSRPGEPPKMRTRLGVRSIAHAFRDDGMVGQVGVRRNAVYMLYLETGTRRIQPRPWLLRAAEETKDMAVAVIRAEMA